MKKLLIIGAGGFGREILGWARQARGFRREWEIGGFLDERRDALDAFPGISLPVIGAPSSYEPGSSDVFICAIGQPGVRAGIRQQMEAHGAAFIRLIHDSCIIGDRVDLAEGVVLCPRVVLTCDIALGANTAINIATAVGHDAVIGADCQISSFCDITGHVHIGNRVFLGSRASILPRNRIGENAIIGAGSVVIRDVEPGVSVFGNPAKILVRHS